MLKNSFISLKKANLLDINIDLDKNSIKTLHNFANSLDEEKYIDTVKALNYIAFDRNSNENHQISLEKDVNNNNKFNKNEDEIGIHSAQNNFIELEFISDDKLVEINDEYYINFIEKQGKLANLYEDQIIIEDSLKKKRKRSDYFLLNYNNHFDDLNSSNHIKDIYFQEPLLSFQDCFNYFFSQQNKNESDFDHFNENDFKELIKFTNESKKMDEKEGNNIFSSENNSDLADIKHKKQPKLLFQTKTCFNNKFNSSNCQNKNKVKFVTNKSFTTQTLKEKEKNNKLNK